jgi:hypothetical protein
MPWVCQGINDCSFGIIIVHGGDVHFRRHCRLRWKLVVCVGAEDRLAADDDHPILLDDFRGRPDRMFKLIPPQDYRALTNAADLSSSESAPANGLICRRSAASSSSRSISCSNSRTGRPRSCSHRSSNRRAMGARGDSRGPSRFRRPISLSSSGFS